MSSKSNVNKYDLFDENLSAMRGRATVNGDSVSGVYTSSEAFAMLFSRVVDSSKQFQQILDLYLELEKELLISTLHKASKDPDEYWKLVEEMKEYTDEQIEKRFTGSSSLKALQPLRAIQKALWNEGSSVVDFGLDPSNFEQFGSDIMKEAFSDIQRFVQAVRVQKEMALDNFIIRLVACLPSQQQRQYKTRQKRLTLLKTLIADFTQGKWPVRFDINKFKLPTEAFLTVPTVLEPKDALTVSVVRLLNSLYDNKLIVAFQEKDMNQIRMYTGGRDDYLLYDEDSDSPYAITRTPALYEDEVNDGIWKWREIESLVNKKANLELTERNISLDNQYERDKIIKSLELKETQIVDEKDQIYFSYDAVVAELPDVLANRFEGKRGIIRIFKRGYSTKDEVEENPEFLHICKKSIARQFESSMYPIVLADLNSVVMIPQDLWTRTRFHRTVSAQGSKSLYLTEHGMRMLSTDSEVLNFFFSMVQVSTFFAMLEDWENGKAFDENAFARKIITATVIEADPTLTKLYVGPFSSLDNRKTQLKKFGMVAGSTITGCLIAPASSRTGKSMLDTLTRNLKSVSEYEQYEQLDFINDGFDMFGDVFDNSYEEHVYDQDDLNNQDHHDDRHSDAHHLDSESEIRDFFSDLEDDD